MRLRTKGVSVLPAQDILLYDKTILVGANGAGKTSILHCLAAAYQGRGLGDIDLKALSLDGKEPVVEVYDGDTLVASLTRSGDRPVLDLRVLGKMTGPGRADYVCGLLGGKIEMKDIKGAVATCTPAHQVGKVAPIGNESDIDCAIATAGRLKREADDMAKTLRAVPAPENRLEDAEVQRQTLDLQGKLDKAGNDRRRGDLIAEGQQVKLNLAGYAGLPCVDEPDKLMAKVKEWSGKWTDNTDRRTQARDQLTAARANLSVLTREAAHLRDGKCPTCHQAVSADVLKVAAIRIDELKNTIAKHEEDIEVLDRNVDKLADAVKRGREALVLLDRIDSLRQAVADLPKATMTPEEKVETDNRLTELHGLKRERDLFIKNSARLAEVEAEAKLYRACESALKALKSEKAASTGFPSHIVKAVKDILGYDLAFGKIGRSQDITVTAGGLTRSITTLSGGEWQVVAALFGTLKPTALVLAELAEVDGVNVLKLLEILKDHKGPVVCASWAAMPEDPAWKVVRL